MKIQTKSYFCKINFTFGGWIKIIKNHEYFDKQHLHWCPQLPPWMLLMCLDLLDFACDFDFDFLSAIMNECCWSVYIYLTLNMTLILTIFYMHFSKYFNRELEHTIVDMGTEAVHPRTRLLKSVKENKKCIKLIKETFQLNIVWFYY